MKVLALALVFHLTARIIVAPLLIGKPRLPWDKNNVYGILFEAAIVISLCGRVLGWW